MVSKKIWRTVRISKEVHDEISDVVHKSDKYDSVSDFLEAEIKPFLHSLETKRTGEASQS